MARRTDTRQRILGSAAELFHTQGYHATGLTELIENAGAPKGSIYFHFPGGKEQIAAEAIGMAAGLVRERLRAVAASAPDPAAGVALIVDALAADLAASGYRRGCPVATVALDAAADNAVIGEACRDGMGVWHSALVEFLVAHGIEAGRAAELATVFLACLEGGLLLARVQKDTAPLRAVAGHLSDILVKELA